jgi:hypothetical protein
MFRRRRLTTLAVAVVTGATVALLAAAAPATAHRADRVFASRDPFGQLRTYTTNDGFDVENPFFQELGTNGRACFSCHRPDQGWTITPEAVQRRFVESRVSIRSSATTTDRTVTTPRTPEAIR